VVTLSDRYNGFLRVTDLVGGKHADLAGGGTHRRLAVAAAGRWVAAAGDDQVTLWHGDRQGEPPQALAIPPAVRSLALGNDGRYLAAGTSTGQVRVWDTGRLPEPVADVANAQANWVDALAFAPDGRTLYSAGHKDRRVRAWDPATGQLKAEWDVFPEETAGAAEGCWALAVAPDGKHLAASGHGGQVFLVDTATGAVVRRLLGGAGSVAFSPDGKWLALGQVAGGWVALWEAATAKSGPAFKAHFPAGVRGVMFSPDSKYLLTSGTDGKVKLWTVADLVAGGGP
jgi:WD40 repeat protein